MRHSPSSPQSRVRSTTPTSAALCTATSNPPTSCSPEPDDEGERRILLADFGIARPLADISGLTATNITLGTVAYAAPEQLKGEDIDGRADQYALAATAFHLLTGAPPYRGTNTVAVISQHLTASPPKLSAYRRDLASLDDAMSTALAKDPDERFTRCRDFAKALTERVTGASRSDRKAEAAVTVAPPVAVPPKTTPVPAIGPKPSWARRTVIAAVVGLTLVGALIFVGIQFSSDEQTTTPTAASITPTLAPPPTSTAQPPPPSSSATIQAPLPPPTTTTITTTAPSTPLAATGAAMGLPCSSE